MIEDQREKQKKTRKKHWKQLIMSNGGKDSFELLKRKEIFAELVNEKGFEINKISKGIYFNSSTYQL